MKQHLEIILDIGCGKEKHLEATGIDASDLPGVDIVANINDGIPIRDNLVDLIYLHHILEHVDDIIKTIEELYRITNSRGLLDIKCPHFSCGYVAWGDPTHKRTFTTQTLNYFNPEIAHRAYYSKAKFKVLSVKLNFEAYGGERKKRRGIRRIMKWFGPFFEYLASINMSLCERIWAQWVGFEEVHFVLKRL